MKKKTLISANRTNRSPIIYYAYIEPLDFKDFDKVKPDDIFFTSTPVVALTKEQFDAMFAKESDKKGLKYD